MAGYGVQYCSSLGRLRTVTWISFAFAEINHPASSGRTTRPYLFSFTSPKILAWQLISFSCCSQLYPFPSRSTRRFATLGGNPSETSSSLSFVESARALRSKREKSKLLACSMALRTCSLGKATVSGRGLPAWTVIFGVSELERQPPRGQDPSVAKLPDRRPRRYTGDFLEESLNLETDYRAYSHRRGHHLRS
ncbi:hypothetical protein FA10DRAFT_202255 [Acaromyces ingoldii]|uniref:Uncharacterized protein n=1 Tax=Acaromyces ingoldii TaxID=215250 RepID=A0A316YCA4_9BASI|nr:hypothetical protein FA10DRAFT_202255 [Acaromyces ingoldii]PWN86902.1 hypothetical protein FA10DRAFT_202255 [Acaromyces ingoldii]